MLQISRRIFMVLPSLFIAPTPTMGRGVYTSEDLDAGLLIEIAPVVVLPAPDRKLIDQTVLHDYIFEWSPETGQCCMALGYVPIYNHSYESNCEYEMDREENLIYIRTVRNVKANEELFINYNGDWNNAEPVWFHK